MKLGILTLHLHTNLGGLLQAFALSHTIEEMDGRLEVCIFNNVEVPIKKTLRQKLGTLKRLFTKHKKELTEEEKLLNHNCMQFCNRFLRIDNLENYRSYDAILVGSDQVWRARYKEFRNAFLPFTKGLTVKRVSYACSLGTKDGGYSTKDIAKVKKLINSFEAISVREKSAIDFIVKELGFVGPIEFVLDPSFLLTPDDYKKNFGETGYSESIPENGLYYYFLDPSLEKIGFVERLSKKFNLTPYTIDKTHRYPVEHWIECFNQAKYVLTDSFHGTALSINYNKPFIAIGNSQRGMERFVSLLSLFGFEKRLIEEAEITNEYTPEVINFSKANAIMEDMRRNSLNFIKKYIAV